MLLSAFLVCGVVAEHWNTLLYPICIKRSRSIEKSAMILESRRIQVGKGLKIRANRSAWFAPGMGSVARNLSLPVDRSSTPNTSTLTSRRFPSVVVVPKLITPSSMALFAPPKLMTSSWTVATHRHRICRKNASTDSWLTLTQVMTLFKLVWQVQW